MGKHQPEEQAQAGNGASSEVEDSSETSVEPAAPLKMWEHPHDRELRVSLKTVTAIALMEMGISDYNIIAEAAGLEVPEVAEIDSATEPDVFRLCILGIPADVSFRLQVNVWCPRCRSLTSIAPCMTCK